MAGGHDNSMTPDQGARPGEGSDMSFPSGGHGPGTAAHEQEHASIKTYVLIGLVLTIITAAEVAVFYIPALHPHIVPILMTMSAAKFALVVMFYMHLKFDSRIFSSVFIAPMILALGVVASLIILFKVLPNYAP